MVPVRYIKLILGILLGALVGLGGYLVWSSKALSYLSEDPKVCVNCHIMNEQYDGWQKASHHAVATCNDCHSPQAFFAKYISKAENGFWHSKGFTLQDFAEPIRIRPHNKKVLNDNCASCHQGLVSELILTSGRDASQLDCVRCHANVGHGASR